MSARVWNWRLWVGFGCAVAALIIYFIFFIVTRAVVWPCLALLVIAAALLISGMQRALREPLVYRGKIGGTVVSVLSVLLFVAFGFVAYQVHRAFPAARNAPNVGQHAPEFSLADSTGRNVALTDLLASPITDGSGSAHASKGVLVVFYRGYW